MKKRNKQFLKEKEYIRVKNELDNNYKTQRNLGWVELDNPIHIGYTAFLILRDDISRRDDSHIFESILEFSTSEFARKLKDFNFDNKKNRMVFYTRPHIRDINESIYINLPIQIQKWFSLLTTSNRTWGGKWYSCNVPSFYFTVSYEKKYKTKIQIIDEVLLQEESELESIIQNKFYNEFRYMSSAPKYFRKNLNRQQRAKSKQSLYNLIYKDDDRSFEDNYKNANWLWW